MTNPAIRLGLMGLWLSVTPLGCSSSDTGKDAPAGAQAFADEVARVSCAAKAACCTGQGETQDEERCRELTSKVELSRGEHFDPAVAQACLAALEGYTCDGDYPMVCLAVFYGDVPLGGACDFDSDCARPDGAMTGCVGDASLENMTCRRLITSAPGEPCGVEQPQSTTEHRVCAEGLVCSGVCEARLPAGAECSGQLCAEGTCEWDAAASTKLCVAYRAVGESCSDRKCVESAYCGADAICQPKKKAGEACDSDAECADICHPETHLCAEDGFYCW